MPTSSSVARSAPTKQPAKIKPPACCSSAPKAVSAAIQQKALRRLAGGFFACPPGKVESLPKMLLVGACLLEVAAFNDGDGGRVDMTLEGCVDLFRCERGDGGLQFGVPQQGAAPAFPARQLHAD